MKKGSLIIVLALTCCMLFGWAVSANGADYYIMPGCNPPGYTSTYPCPNCDDDAVYDRYDETEYVPYYECYPTYRRVYHSYECYPPVYEDYPPYECYPKGYILKTD